MRSLSSTRLVGVKTRDKFRKPGKFTPAPAGSGSAIDGVDVMGADEEE